MSDRINSVVIGGGHAGLSISYFLTERGMEHIVPERGTIGETWRSKRWDSFSLVTPNWMNQLPRFPYQGPDPDGFLLRNEILEYLESYAVTFKMPVRSGETVTSLKSDSIDGGYTVETADGSFSARNVVVATGAFQQPKIPSFSAEILESVYQIATSEYRNPDRVPQGKVLIVGSGQSGCQIAEELNSSGREVYLCTSGCGWIPRRYRGKDTTWWWANQMGRFDRTVDQFGVAE